MRMILRTVSAVLLLALALGACSRAADPEDRRVQVVATFYPLAEAAQRIGGDSVEVTNLTPPGVEPHDLELSPDALEAISEADVVLTIGGGFQPAVEEAIATEAAGTVVDALDLVTTIGDDPHVWLDPQAYRDLVAGVAEAIAGAGGDTAGADPFIADLTALDTSFERGLGDCRSRILVTSHDAFGYLTARYDLRQEPATGLSPEAEPDPARLAQLEELIRAEGVSTVFTESLASPRVAETLARETGVRTAVLNPLEGLTQEQVERGDGYLSVMRENLSALREGLDCA